MRSTDTEFLDVTLRQISGHDTFTGSMVEGYMAAMLVQSAGATLLRRSHIDTIIGKADFDNSSFIDLYAIEFLISRLYSLRRAEFTNEAPSVHLDPTQPLQKAMVEWCSGFSKSIADNIEPWSRMIGSNASLSLAPIIAHSEGYYPESTVEKSFENIKSTLLRLQNYWNDNRHLDPISKVTQADYRRIVENSRSKVRRDLPVVVQKERFLSLQHFIEFTRRPAVRLFVAAPLVLGITVYSANRAQFDWKTLLPKPIERASQDVYAPAETQKVALFNSEQAESDQYAQKLVSLEQDIVQKTALLTQKTTDFETVKLELDETTSKNAELQSQIQALTANALKPAEFAALESKLAEKDTSLQAVKAELIDAKNALNALEIKNNTLKQEVFNKNTVLAQADTANKQLTTLQSGFDAAQAEIERLKSELSAANTLREQLETKLAAQTDTATTETAELETLKNSLDEKANLIADLKKQLEASQAVKNELDQLKTNLATQSNELISKDEEIAALKQAQSETSSSAETLLKELTSTNESMTNELRATQDETALLKEQLKAIETELSAVKTEGADLNSTLEETRAQLIKQEQVAAEYEAKLASLEIENSKLGATQAQALETAQNALAEEQKNVEALKLELQNAQNASVDAQALSEKIASLETQVKSLEASNLDLSEQNKALTAQLSESAKPVKEAALANSSETTSPESPESNAEISKIIATLQDKYKFGTPAELKALQVNLEQGNKLENALTNAFGEANPLILNALCRNFETFCG